MQLRNKIDDTIFRIYRIAGRWIVKYSGNPRPHSYPFITGDGFRKLANHIYDNVVKLDPAMVQDGDVIFVGDSLIDVFIRDVHPRIRARYVLITHNGDASVTQDLLDQVASSLIRWYGINVEVDDPRVVPIPLGIENKHYFVCGIPSLFRKVMKSQVSKINKIFYGFTVSTNPTERQAALDAIQKSPYGETLSAWRGFKAYLIHLNTFKFVLSPPGSSVEGHRTWDTLYIGGIPIVKSSITMRSFKDLGLPLWVLDDWAEIHSIDAEKLEQMYIHLKQKENKEPLFMPYWIDRILTDTRT